MGYGSSVIARASSQFGRCLLADSALRFNLSETPDYGLYCLRWNQDLLVDGILSLQEMTLVLSSGLLLKLKANAQIASLKLNIPGTSFLSVYLHVRNNSDYMGERVESTNTTRRGDVSCWLWQLELSIYQDNPDTLDSFHLVDFEKKTRWFLVSFIGLHTTACLLRFSAIFEG